MPNILTLTASNPDQLLNASAYGAGAVIQVQSGPASSGPFANDGTTAIVSGTTSYTYYDTDGTSSTWYRTRYENVGETVTSEWSEVFKADQGTAYARYVTPTILKARLNLSNTTTNDALFDEICDETNQWIESYVGRVLGPVASATYLFDGGGPDNPNATTLNLWRLGVRSITSLEVANQTGGSYTTLDPSDYYIRPLNNPNGEPGTRIHLDGQYFYSGFSTIRVTMAAGFATVPDDVRGVAIAIATRSWHGRQSGQADVVGNDETGSPIVSKIVALEHKKTLDRYRPVLVR